MSDASGQNERNWDRLGEESGIIVFGGAEAGHSSSG